jgi:tripeptide aminopeptidase
VTPNSLVDEIAIIAAIPSPTFHEGARLDWIADRLRDTPGRLQRDAVGNVILHWGDGRPKVLVTAHVDTVFPLSTPIVIEQSGRRLVGPGVGDNAAAIAVAIHVVEALLRTDDVACGALAFTVGEEGLGNLRGARQACEDLTPEAVIALEGHGLETVIADALGSIRARVAISGPGGHAWTDRGHPSAIHTLVQIAAETLQHDGRHAPVNIGLIDGGLAVNAIAGQAEMVLEKRSSNADELLEFVRFLHTIDCDPPLTLTVDILGDRPAATLPRNSRLLRTVLAVRNELGLGNVIEAGSTDANAAMGLGIPGLGLGVSEGRDMHTIHESIDLASLPLGAKQLELVLAALLAGQEQAVPRHTCQ